VLLLHYASVFIPLYAHEGTVAHYEAEHWLATSPLFLAVDGGTAVCLFFVISGFVLSSSFSRLTTSAPGAVLRRTLRLLVPVAVAAMFAWLCLGFSPPPMDELHAVTASDFVGRVYPTPVTGSRVLKDISVQALFLGYDPVSIFSGQSWISLPTLDQSVDPPFWTLHIEFWGSMLVLALTLIRRELSRSAMLMVLVGVLLVVGTSWYFLFVVGFVLHQINASFGARNGTIPAAVGALLVLLGSSIALSKANTYVHSIYEALGPLVHGQALNTYTFQSCVAGALIFLGVVLSSPLRTLATCRPALFLGRLSFGMYLLHFPVLFAVAARVFLVLLPVGYGVAAISASIAGIAITGCLAYAFDRFVDGRVIWLSHRIAAAIDAESAAGRPQAVPHKGEST
jgi:peptidoglycan/LPS O-acetylase OafA/YrhL